MNIYSFLICSRNTIKVINKRSRSIYVGFFKNLGPYQPSFQSERTIYVRRRSSKIVTLANGWEGRVQKLSGAPADPATWAEIKFDASFMGMTFCDISLIRGFNGAMQFSSQDGSLRTGFTDDLYPDAPEHFKTQDSGGNNVLQPTQPYSDGTNDELVNYYRRKVPTGAAYVLPDDNASSHGTTDKTMNLAIY